MTLVFEDPPAPRSSWPGHRVVDELAPLREQPGRWARVRGPYDLTSQASSFVRNLKTGRVAGIKPGEYECVSRKVDGQVWIWARYMGPVG